jgi:hypothetical protein
MAVDTSQDFLNKLWQRIWISGKKDFNHLIRNI